jgi:hypothetical protein
MFTKEYFPQTSRDRDPQRLPKKPNGDLVTIRSHAAHLAKLIRSRITS